METAKVFLLSLLIQGYICISKAQNVCTDQPGSIRVEKKETVTIPCYFSYPENINPTRVRVSWRTAASGRCAQNDFIYNHTDKWLNTSYQWEFTVQGGIMTDRMAAITITILKKLKKSMFCCRIELDNYNQSPDLKWQNQHGTYMLFKGEASVEQPDVVLAVQDEDVAIPCIVHNIKPESIQEVTLRKGTSDVCSENKDVKTRLGKDKIKEYVWQSPQENTWKLLLPIRNVRSSDSGQYCCDVKATPAIPSERQPAHGTQVVTVDPKDSTPEFTATQPGEISAQRGDAVTINCSYTVPPGQTPLWTGVFWRVGGPSGIHAYHPYRLMVDSSYYGRTDLEGLANLRIKDIVETDNATYYCFVMLKFCTGNNSASSVIHYGGGTQLTISGKPQEVWKIIVGFVILLILIILCVVLVILKKKGIICEGNTRRDPSSITSGSASLPQGKCENVPMPDIQPEDSTVGQESSDGVLYARLKMEPLQQGAGKKSKEVPSSSDSQVLYATVKHPESNVIYSTVHR
ncbi:uncharacterized protein [Hyperolius riggenbachi]|uniref:uncharacterized protein isoform X2 n=1 Tax=Hyperolius riggenbachi TaxID=752182 RepID=UPI0035A33C39